MREIDIRESRPDDIPILEDLYSAAFSEEDLLPLVRKLLAGEAKILSLVAFVDEEVVGHILFTQCGIAGTPVRVALLGPLAVTPAWQRKGVGSALIRNGLERLGQSGVGHVCVLGDPAYYGRHGFTPDTALAPPYPLPEEYCAAWQSLRLDPAAEPVAGSLTVPEAWMQPALWG